MHSQGTFGTVNVLTEEIGNTRFYIVTDKSVWEIFIHNMLF